MQIPFLFAARPERKQVSSVMAKLRQLSCRMCQAVKSDDKGITSYYSKFSQLEKAV